MNALKTFDRAFLTEGGFRNLIGIDEAGRGPLAGPVVAAAVLLKEMDFSARIQDSKKMTARQRGVAFLEIQENAYIGIGIMNEQIIDACNILQASFLAMTAAVRRLETALARAGLDMRSPSQKACLLVDGNMFQTELPYDYRTVIDGDQKSLSIACASIIAKVTRDRILDTYHRIFPQYGFDRHKGYPTRMHRQALEDYGPVFVHRRTFRTVREACQR